MMQRLPTPAGEHEGLWDAFTRARRGDQQSFAELVRAHQAMVYSIAHNFLRDREAAEDLAQDVFLHLYQHLTALESPDHLKFWLRKVTSHRCIDYARKQKVPVVALEEAPEPVSRFEPSDAMMNRTVRKMLAALPEKPRLVVTLRYQEDLDPSEIAEILEMPVNTVKSHLRRSLAILREKVSRFVGEVEV